MPILATRGPKMKKTISYSYVHLYYENIGWNEIFNFDIFFDPFLGGSGPKNAFLGHKGAKNEKTEITLPSQTFKNKEMDKKQDLVFSVKLQF